MSPGRPATAESVAAATRSALRLAADKNINSIAFPALGTGVGGLSLHDCAEAMLGAVRQHCTNHEQPEEVHFVLFGDNALTIFRDVFAAMEE